jgi:hypothetical protein
VIREGINVEKHVAATNLAKPTMTCGLRVKILSLISALENPERLPFHDGNDGHRSATDIRTVCTQAVMHFKRRLVVFKTNWVVSASTSPCYGKIVTRHISLLRLSFVSPVF